MLQPYYSAAGVTIYNCKWQEVVASLGDSLQVDLVLGDPPYGIDYDPNGGTGVAQRQVFERVIGDDEEFDPTPFLQYPHVVLWGANHFAHKLPSSSGWICWVKIGDGGPRDCSDCELAWTNHHVPARRFNHLWRGMIRASERNEPRIHPTQKPVALMKFCIDMMAQKQDEYGPIRTIFEPFMGSAPGLIAAREMGYQAIGCEIKEKYCEAAAKRLEQLCLFAPGPVIEHEPRQLATAEAW